MMMPRCVRDSQPVACQRRRLRDMPGSAVETVVHADAEVWERLLQDCICMTVSCTGYHTGTLHWLVWGPRAATHAMPHRPSSNHASHNKCISSSHSTYRWTATAAPTAGLLLLHSSRTPDKLLLLPLPAACSCRPSSSHAPHACSTCSWPCWTATHNPTGCSCCAGLRSSWSSPSPGCSLGLCSGWGCCATR